LRWWASRCRCALRRHDGSSQPLGNGAAAVLIRGLSALVEQARIIQLLVARVVVRLDGLEISLRVEGITSVLKDLRLRESTERQGHDRGQAESRRQHDYGVRAYGVGPARRTQGHHGAVRL
jgi:hypothetical protein